MPMSEPKKWWEELPVKWPEIMPEWGAKVTGIFNFLYLFINFIVILLRKEEQ